LQKQLKKKSFTLGTKEIEMIKKSLEKKRKTSSTDELGISESFVSQNKTV
jgi:hypothetical protein